MRKPKVKPLPDSGVMIEFTESSYYFQESRIGKLKKCPSGLNKILN
jgi:hypothetical protein